LGEDLIASDIDF